MVFGAVGYLLRKGGFPAAPMVLAMILGPPLERTLQQALIGSGGDLQVFLRGSISPTLLLAAVALVLSPAVQWLWQRRRGRTEAARAE